MHKGGDRGDLVLQSIKPKSAFLYSIQVWLTCALLGPAVWYYIESADVRLRMTFNEFYWIGLLAGLVYTLPSFLLLFAVVAYLNHRDLELMSKKFIVAGSALSFEITSCMIYFHYMSTPPAIKEIGFSIFVAYSIPLFLAIFLYRFPIRKGYQ